MPAAETVSNHDISKMKRRRRAKTKIEKIDDGKPVMITMSAALNTRLSEMKKTSGNSISRLINFAVTEAFDRKLFEKIPDHEPAELRKARAILEKYRLKPIY